jgi:TP901 family phage tail tape measure protein
MPDYTISVDLLLKDLASKELKKFQKLIKDIKPDFTALSAAAGASVAAIGALGISAIKVASDFQRGMTEVFTLVDLTDKEMELLSEQTANLSEIVPQTAIQLSKGLYQVLSASIPVEKAMHVLDISARAATAGLTSTFNAVDVLTTILNSYGFEAEETLRISDILFETVRRGKTTFAELSAQIGMVVTPAAAAGITFEEVAAAIATMTKKGLDTAMATTYLRQVIMSILSPTAEATKIAKKLGIDFSAAGLKAKGLADFLKEVDKAAKGNNEILTTLFGNVRAFTGVLTISGKGAKTFAEDLAAMQTSAGATMKAFDKIMEDTAATMSILFSTFENFLRQLGNIFLPTVNQAGRILINIISTTKQWISENKELVKNLTIITISVGSFISAVALGNITMPYFIGAMKALGVAITGTISAIKTLTIFFLKTPLGWLTIGIGILVGEFFKLRKETNTLIQQYNDKIVQIQTLINRYNSLTAVVETDTQAMKRQQEILNELKILLPENAALIENLGKKTEITTREIEKINRALLQRYNLALQEMTQLERIGHATINLLKRTGVALLGLAKLTGTAIIALFRYVWSTIKIYFTDFIKWILDLSAKISDIFLALVRLDWARIKKAGIKLGQIFSDGVAKGLLESGWKIQAEWEKITADFLKDTKKIGLETVDIITKIFQEKPIKPPKLLKWKKEEVPPVPTPTPVPPTPVPPTPVPPTPVPTPVPPTPVPTPETIITPMEELKNYFDEFFASIQNKAELTKEIFLEMTHAMTNTLSRSIAQMLDKTISFKEGIKGIWRDMKNAVINMISEMIAKWLTFMALKGIGRLFGIPIPLPTMQTEPGEYKIIPGAPNVPTPIIAHGGEIIGRPPIGTTQVTVNINAGIMLGGDADLLTESIKQLFQERDFLVTKGLTT